MFSKSRCAQCFFSVSLLLSLSEFLQWPCRISLVFLNFWTLSIISFYFLFSVKPFTFVLDLFPYCLSPVTLLHQLFSISSIVSISLPLHVPIDFKYAQIVLRKKEKNKSNKAFPYPYAHLQLLFSLLPFLPKLPERIIYVFCFQFLTFPFSSLFVSLLFLWNCSH